MGLEGAGMLREPIVLVLGLRLASLSSLSPTPSLTPLGLRLGCVVPGTPGPPDRCETRILTAIISSFTQTDINSSQSQKSVPLISIYCLTEVRVTSLAVVGGDATLCLVARGGRRCTRGGRSSVFGGSIGDGSGSDSS